MPRLRELLQKGRARLSAPDSAARDTPDLDARVLLEFLFGLSRAQLLTGLEDAAEDAQIQRYEALLERRVHGEPVAYLTGVKEFCGLEFAVEEGVLVPRPETETLVDAALKEWKRRDGSKGFRLVDIGTGSGCVAVGLLYLGQTAGLDRTQVEAEAVDISPVAAAVAKKNAQRLLGPEVLKIHVGDLMTPLSGLWDVIVSNPPYLTPAETEERVGALQWKEPALALDGGGDGLDLIRRLSAQAAQKLRPQGLLLLEAAPHQRVEILKLLNDSGFTETGVLKDLAGLDRVYCARKTW